MTLNQYVKWGHIISALVYVLSFVLIIWVLPWHNCLSWIGISMLTLLYVLFQFILIICKAIFDTLPAIISSIKQAWYYMMKCLTIYFEEMFRLMFYSSSENNILEKTHRRIEQEVNPNKD